MNDWFDSFQRIMAMVGAGVDALGVLVILGGALVALYRLFAINLPRGGNLYQMFRQDLGRSILLGLEFLIAGDIIRTVVVDPTLVNVLILGLDRVYPHLSQHGAATGNRPPLAVAAAQAAAGMSARLLRKECCIGLVEPIEVGL